MFGVWAVFFIERPGRRTAVIASVLLLASLASSDMGLFFLVVTSGRTIADPALRRRALAVVPPFGVYLLWFLVVGRDPLGEDSVFIEPAAARFAVRGIVYATERFGGLDHFPDGYAWALLLFLALSLIVGLRIVRGRPPALAAGCLVAVVTMYTVIAFGRLRADPGYDHAVSSRFVYVAAFFLVLAVVDLLPPWSSWALRTRRSRIAATAVFLPAVAFVTAANVLALVETRSEFQQTAERTRAFVEVALARGHEPWVDRSAPRGWMPSVSKLERTTQLHGSPLHDDLFPGVIDPPDAAAKEAALLRLIGDGFRVEDARGPSGRCVRAQFGPGAAAWVLGLTAGARVRIASSSRMAARVFLAHKGGPGRPIYADLDPDVPQDVVIPDIGDGRLWELAVDSVASPGAVKLCVVPAGGNGSGRRPTVILRSWK
jgi:hypothetical protein